jgi:hypothetical protein
MVQYQFTTIGRIYSISPRKEELFHLRLLLYTIKGPTSFESLRLVDNYLCQTFKESCEDCCKQIILGKIL